MERRQKSSRRRLPPSPRGEAAAAPADGDDPAQAGGSGADGSDADGSDAGGGSASIAGCDAQCSVPRQPLSSIAQSPSPHPAQPLGSSASNGAPSASDGVCVARHSDTMTAGAPHAPGAPLCASTSANAASRAPAADETSHPLNEWSRSDTTSRTASRRRMVPLGSRGGNQKGAASTLRSVAAGRGPRLSVRRSTVVPPAATVPSVVSTVDLRGLRWLWRHPQIQGAGEELPKPLESMFRSLARDGGRGL